MMLHNNDDDLQREQVQRWHGFSAPHDQPTVYDEAGLCDQCVVTVQGFVRLLLPVYMARMQEQIIRELAVVAASEDQKEIDWWLQDKAIAARIVRGNK